MDRHAALLALAAEHRLEPAARQRLRQQFGLASPPALRTRSLHIVLALVAATLIGLGLVFGVAANWQALDRRGHFIVIQGALVTAGVLGVLRPAWRAPCGLAVLLLIGALLAYMGQTYQTGADPWQLFALWAALAVPLCLAGRTDVLWVPWVLVAMTGLVLWSHAPWQWQSRHAGLSLQLQAWVFAAAITAALSRVARRWTGAGPWTPRAALMLTVAMMANAGLAALLHDRVSPAYGFAIVTLAGLVLALATRRVFDIVGLCTALLALDSLLVAGAARLLLGNAVGHDPIAAMIVLVGLAAGLLGLSVRVVMALSRRYA